MIFFSDFDGTLTLEGQGLTRHFFEIMELIQSRGHELVIVSGRSISWGHFFLTHFPQLRACVMEGGGVILSRDTRGEIVEEPLVSAHELERLRQFTTQLKHHYPHVPLSVDSFGRLTDRAIEFHLMEEPWINQVMNFMDTERINYSKSNVHINFWCGTISKFLGVKRFLAAHRPGVADGDCWFFGDAPNDESMFEFFANSVGVSNIDRCLAKLRHRPRIILEGEENVGPKGVLNFVRARG
jgi:HAD superfamily hydrolase (TIGR01484 family)